MDKHDIAHRLVNVNKMLKVADDVSTQPSVIDAIRQSRAIIYDIVEAIGPDLLRREYD